MKSFSSLLAVLIMATLIGLGLWYFQTFPQSGDFGGKAGALLSEAKQKDSDFQKLISNFETNLSLTESSSEHFDTNLAELDKLVSFNNELKQKTSALPVPENGGLIYDKLCTTWEKRGQALSSYQDFVKATKEAASCHQRSKQMPEISPTDETYLQRVIEAETVADEAVAEARRWEERAQGYKQSHLNAYTEYTNALQDVEYQIDRGL